MIQSTVQHDSNHNMSPSTVQHDSDHNMIPTTTWFQPQHDFNDNMIPTITWFRPQNDSNHNTIPTPTWLQPKHDSIHNMILTITLLQPHPHTHMIPSATWFWPQHYSIHCTDEQPKSHQWWRHSSLEPRIKRFNPSDPSMLPGLSMLLKKNSAKEELKWSCLFDETRLEFLVCCWNASARDGVVRRFAVDTTWRYLFYAVLCLLTNPVWLNPSSEKQISESLYSSLELEKNLKVYKLCNCSQITRSISHWYTIWSLDISVTISYFPSV